MWQANVCKVGSEKIDALDIAFICRFKISFHFFFFLISVYFFFARQVNVCKVDSKDCCIGEWFDVYAVNFFFSFVLKQFQAEAYSVIDIIYAKVMLHISIPCLILYIVCY